MSIDIHLRLRGPRDVVTLIDALGEALDEAHDMVADDHDAAPWVNDLEELWETIWRCLQESGYTRGEQGAVLFCGRDLRKERDLGIQPINSEGVVLK